MIGRQKQRKFQRVPKRIYKEKSKINTSIKGESHRIPFVTTFNPTLPNIPQVISRNLNILRFSQRCLEAFSSPPRISYRCCKNLRDILVRAKHRSQASTPPPPPAASGASIHCHSNRCKTCPFITEGTTSYTFFSTNEQRRIRHHITCSSSESHRNACYATWAISDHFTLLSHSVDNIELVPLELTTSNDSNRDAIRKEREAFLISKANFSFNII